MVTVYNRKMVKEIDILLLDDDKIEVMKLERALATLESNHNLQVANNGEEAIQMLNDAQELPDLILLDLNMPKLNGVEFLSIIKSDQQLNHIPTVILTTSINEKDLLECYKHGVAGYVLKPLKYEDYLIKMKYLINYWAINEFKQ